MLRGRCDNFVAPMIQLGPEMACARPWMRTATRIIAAMPYVGFEYDVQFQEGPTSGRASRSASFDAQHAFRPHLAPLAIETDKVTGDETTNVGHS